MGKKKCWRVSLGECGCRVIIFERKPGSILYREVYIGGKRVAAKKSLRHRDKDRAKADGYKLLATLTTRQDALSGGRLTLQMLFDMHVVSPAFHAKGMRTQQDDRRKLERVVAFLGRDRNVQSLTDGDVVSYRRARRRGEITGNVVGDRAVQADLSCLRAMLNWGVRQRQREGTPLLPYNPLQGVRLPSEKNPLRPVASWERFLATREVMQARQQRASSEGERRRWLLLELALVLAEATGRRLGSIRQLRWEDLQKSQIRWRGEADKQGRQWTMPMPDSLERELKRFQHELGALGGWMFPSPANPEKPLERYWFDKGLRRAERLADLEPLKGSLWHAYRRKWGTERKHLPVTDVAQAGGWKDTSTLLTCYQQPDHDTMRRVLNEPRKVLEHEVG